MADGLLGDNMPRELRAGLFKFEGSEPMSFVESNERPTGDWTPEQKAASHAVSEAIRLYLQTVESLASGKFEHLGSKIPEYMAHPGNVLIAVCTDGIVIRYERTVHEKRRLAVSVMDSGIADVASLLSQKLVHVQSLDQPHPIDDDFGIELKLVAQAPGDGTSRDLASARIWFQVTNAEPQKTQPSLKPYCLLSVRNQLDVEIHGVLQPEGDDTASGQPVIVRSRIRLKVGWECIEVFPGLDLTGWKMDLAPLWAENDILSASLVADMRDAQLSNLDPRASARRHFALLLSEFKQLLDSNPDREQTLQAFLQSNPALLCPTQVKMWPKLALGATITDFVFRDATQDYLLVELERSTLSLFRQDGHPTAELTHAQGQIVDWKRYLEDNLQTVQRELGLTGITPNPGGLVVIGRSQALSPTNRRKLKTMMNEIPKLRIMTYDDVYESAKAVLENLLGPMWDTGGLTQIYYPSAK